ncbi:embryonic protein UVS.2-like [Dendronephthya gigantea]|uniref:embryonic protein UVS.2-like n=1 Tax=Dendronephthya gigantea TaxID=151771 RepID=UPI001069873E|nr:embryonic protein UVS.2-like [Dendronephthya gigantea]
MVFPARWSDPYSCGSSYLYTPGRLTSPRYPYDYPRNTDCTWNISSNNATNVLLKFSFFWLEGGSSCRYDYLDVYDGNSMYAKKLGRFCGQQFPRELVSSGSKLFIVFHTDGSGQEQGFVLDYTSTTGTNSYSSSLFYSYILIVLQLFYHVSHSYYYL